MVKVTWLKPQRISINRLSVALAFLVFLSDIDSVFIFDHILDLILDLILDHIKLGYLVLFLSTFS